MPVAFATERSQDCLTFARSQCQEMADLGTHMAPLFPVTHANTPSYPPIDAGNGPVVVRDAKVAHPTSEVLGEPIESVVHRDPRAASGEFPNAVLKVVEGLIGPTQIAPSESKSEENHVMGATNSALLLVDDELELRRQVPRDARFDAVAGSFASHEDQKIIGVTREPVATSSEFTVEIIQQDVGEQRRERGTLHGSKLRCLEGVPDPDAGSQVTSDEGKQALVAHLSGHACHQYIVLDTVEKFLQVQVNGDAIAFTDIPLYRPQCAMSAASGSKPDKIVRNDFGQPQAGPAGELQGSSSQPRFGEVRVGHRGEDLAHGLPYPPIEHGGDAQHPLASTTGLRRCRPSHRRGLIGALQQGLAEGGPVFLCEGRKLIDAHPIDTGGTPVGLHLLPCAFQILGCHHPHHEVIVQGWLRKRTPIVGSSVRIPHRDRVIHGSSLSHCVWAFRSAPFPRRSPHRPAADFCPLTPDVAAWRAARVAVGAGGNSTSFRVALSPAPLATTRPLGFGGGSNAFDLGRSPPPIGLRTAR